jgi:hypothetical protein
MAEKFNPEEWRFPYPLPEKGTEGLVGAPSEASEAPAGETIESGDQPYGKIMSWLASGSGWRGFKGGQPEKRISESLEFIRRHNDDPRFLAGLDHLAEA